MKLDINEDEKAIILEMLKKEEASIPIEIHHCRTNDFKTLLKAKLESVESLIKKLE